MSGITYKIKDCCEPDAIDHILLTGATYFYKTKTWELTQEEFNQIDMDYFKKVRCVITKEYSKKLPTIEVTGEEMKSLVEFSCNNVEPLHGATFFKRFSQCINHKISSEDLFDNICNQNRCDEIIHNKT
jgi:hypothetical protein